MEMMTANITSENIMSLLGKPYHSIFGHIPYDFKLKYVKPPHFNIHENDIECLRPVAPSFSGESVTVFPARPMAFEEAVWEILRNEYEWKGQDAEPIVSFIKDLHTEQYQVTFNRIGN